MRVTAETDLKDSKMKNIIRNLLVRMKALSDGRRLKAGPPAVLRRVPYFGQWESPELIDKILTGKIRAADDPKWRQSGAETADEYEQWSWNCCGMACLKMILADVRGQTIPLVQLANQCLKYGGYQLPLENSPGLFYRPFLQFIEAEYGLAGQSINTLTLGEIVEALANNCLVIASVDPAIRNQQSSPQRQGGHLILIIGYSRKHRVLYFHNPSGNTPESQQMVKISFNRFEHFFSNRGLTIWAKEDDE